MGTELLRHVLLTLTIFLKYAKFKQASLSSRLPYGEKKKKHETSDSIFQVRKSSSRTLVVGPYLAETLFKLCHTRPLISNTLVRMEDCLPHATRTARDRAASSPPQLPGHFSQPPYIWGLLKCRLEAPQLQSPQDSLWRVMVADISLSQKLQQAQCASSWTVYALHQETLVTQTHKQGTLNL